MFANNVSNMLCDSTVKPFRINKQKESTSSSLSILFCSHFKTDFLMGQYNAAASAHFQFSEVIKTAWRTWQGINKADYG